MKTMAANHIAPSEIQKVFDFSHYYMRKCFVKTKSRPLILIPIPMTHDRLIMALATLSGERRIKTKSYDGRPWRATASCDRKKDINTTK